jgi:glycerophosphoryl diester phosphodiesterase
MGAPWIECDVRVVEGQGIIFHDRSLKRMAGIAASLAGQSLQAVTSLSLPKGERVPLLREVLSSLRGEVSLQIELKGADSGLITALEVLKALEQGWTPHSLLVSSFDHEELLTFKQTAPTVPVGLLTYGYPLRCTEIATILGAYSVHLHLDSVTQARVSTLHSAGFKVFVYTVNEPDDIALMRALGVDGVFTDFPDRVLNTDKL